MIGLPSLLATLGFAVGAFIFGSAPPQDHSPYLSLKTYGPTGALQNGAHAIGNVLSFIGMLAASVLVVLTVVALAVTLFAVLLYVTGRGLKLAAAWARIVAGLVSVLMLASSVIALSALSQGGKLVDALIMAGLLYGLWVLIWRFADPPPNLIRTTPTG